MKVIDPDDFQAKLTDVGLSYQTLANHVQLSKSFVHKVAQGRGRVDEVDAKAIAKALRTPLSKLFRTEAKPSRVGLR